MGARGESDAIVTTTLLPLTVPLIVASGGADEALVGEPPPPHPGRSEPTAISEAARHVCVQKSRRVGAVERSVVEGMGSS